MGEWRENTQDRMRRIIVPAALAALLASAVSLAHHSSNNTEELSQGEEKPKDFLRYGDYGLRKLGKDFIVQKASEIQRAQKSYVELSQDSPPYSCLTLKDVFFYKPFLTIAMSLGVMYRQAQRAFEECLETSAEELIQRSIIETEKNLLITANSIMYDPYNKDELFNDRGSNKFFDIREILKMIMLRVNNLKGWHESAQKALLKVAKKGSQSPNKISRSSEEEL